MKLSIIVPVFNEEKTVREVIDKVSMINIPDTQTEIVIVDDGSVDNTKNEIKKASQGRKNIHYFSHSSNKGKGAAIQTAIEHATGKYVVIQDADLEYDPKDIVKLVVALGKKKKIAVYGTRLKRFPHVHQEEHRPLFLLHFFGTRFLSLVTSILFGQWITDMETCYKLFPLASIKGQVLRAKGFDFEPEITAKLVKQGYKIIEIPITTKPRNYEEGKKLHTFRDGSIALFVLIRERFYK